MVIAIIGENCTGKSTLAEKIRTAVDAQVIAGKDYLRMAKSEAVASALFRQKLETALSGENLIYVISEMEHLAFLPQGTVKILVCADLNIIKERFRTRMRGNLPAPVEAMLEKKHGMFSAGSYDFIYDSGKDDPEKLCQAIESLMFQR